MDIRRWSTTPASNNTASPDGFPEGMAPGGVNDSEREIMAALKGVWNAGVGYYVTKAANYTIDATDNGVATTNDNRRLIDCTATLTLTVPAASGVTADFGCWIHNSGGTGIVTVTRSGADTINGGAGSVKLYRGETAALARVSATAWRLIFLNRIALLEQKSAAVSATLDFTLGLDDGDFYQYVFHVRNLRPDTDAANLFLRVSDDGGGTFKAGATDYDFSVASLKANTAGWTAEANSTGANAIRLTTGQGSTSGEGCNGTVLFGLAVSNGPKSFTGDLTYYDDTPTHVLKNAKAMGSYATTNSTINGVRFLFNAGNLDVGSITLFGIRA